MGSKTAYAALPGPYVAQLGPHVPPLELHVPQLGRPELPQRLPDSIFERFWSPRDLEKNSKSVILSTNFELFATSHGLTEKRSKRLQKVTPGRPKWTPGASQEAPGAPQEAPGAPREVPRAAQEPPGASQAHPGAAQIPLSSGLGSQMGPTWRPRALRRPPRGHFGPSLGRCSTPPGTIFTHFSTFRTAFC